MKTVLAVDDSSSMRKMVAFTLQSSGYKVLEASDGAEGVALAKANQVDLIISDINMPNMDGIELVKTLRAEANYKFTPILLLTTESGMDKKVEGKNAGATGWIVKPFSPDQLLGTVAKVLG